MTKSRRVRGQSTSSIGTANFRNSVQFVKFVKKQVRSTWRRRSQIGT
jgi:hypothetical protein